MKKKVRKALAISGMTLAIGASGLIIDANASTESTPRIQRSHQERINRSKNFHSEENKNRSRKSFSGVVIETSENSMTFLSGEKTYTARLTKETRLLNKSWNNISFSDIKNGDKIKVFGSPTEDIIAAKTIRVIF